MVKKVQKNKVSPLMITSILSIVSIIYVFLNIFSFRSETFETWTLFLIFILGICLLVFFLWSLWQISYFEQKERLIEEEKAAILQEAIGLMQENRNDVLNSLAVVNSYLELGKYAQAQEHLDFIVADQRDKFEYNSNIFTNDPWETVIKSKQAEALAKDILFSIDLEACPPENKVTKRLVARIMANLVEKAFHAVGRISNPQVNLRWYRNVENVLEVSSNCDPAIQENTGTEDWNLLICHKLAAEVGGSLTVEFTKLTTVYRFSYQG